jgi:hypothetical protein
MFEQNGFTGAAFTDDASHLTFFYRKVDPVKHFVAGKIFINIYQFNERLIHN